MNHLKRLILLFLSIFAGVNALAQFEVGGGDPGRYRWNEYDTENYRIIYPGRTIQGRGGTRGRLLHHTVTFAPNHPTLSSACPYRG